MSLRSRMLCVVLSVMCLPFGLFAAEKFIINDPGTEDIVSYGQYGVFENVGTENYKYRITKNNELKNAVGEGVFPNTTGLLQDPAYKKVKTAGKLKGNQWDYVNGDDNQLNFYKWASCAEEPGVRQYYTALALEKSGNLKQAVKAYYSVVVNFPRSIGYTYWKSPWYIGPVSIDRIKYITREHPEVGMKIVGAEIKVKNRFDNDIKNDVFVITPGKIVRAAKKDLVERKINLSKLPVIRTIGTGKVKLLEYVNKHWQLMVDDKPYYVRGIAYSPNKVGLSPDNGSLNVSRDWMFADFNNNGIIDGPYESWVDKNRNNKQDAGEKPVGDFKLMKDMGVNTLRLYHHSDFNKQLLREGYEKYGFMYLMGDFIGMYCTGSKANWYEGTDYTKEDQQQNMLDSVRQMVMEYKDEPYILMWVLGNENNYGSPGVKGVTAGTGCRAKLQPDAYYAFANKAARLIKELDPQQRPVAICNGDTLFLDKCAANAPDIDVFGANAYRGDQGFGSLWQDVKDVYDRPVLVTEYGCSAYHKTWTTSRCEAAQATYLRGNWIDMESNFAGSGVGNALGGILFEWSDEWWKAGPPPEFDPARQDTVGQFGAPFLDGWSYEEWLGVVSQGDGKNSPFLRQLRPAYFEYKKMWKPYKN